MNLIKNKCYVNGKWLTTDQKLDVVNPYSQSLITQIPQVDCKIVDQAIDIATSAFHTWRKVIPAERAKILKDWNSKLLNHKEAIARLITEEQGKPIAEARAEVDYAASYITFYAEEATRIEGDIIHSPNGHDRLLVIKQPIGPVGIITPWNFPIAMMVRKVAPALAAGCTCIIKPDNQTPLSAIAVISLLVDEINLPEGVVNIITGESEMIGERLTQSEKVKKISFTGSTKVGTWLMAHSAPTLKKLTLELGGNAPFIVFEDANLDQAVEGLINAKFRNAGQTCICVNRVFLHKSIKAAFLSRLADGMKDLTVGDGAKGVDIGPVINADAKQKVEELIDEALNEGATLYFQRDTDSSTPTLMAPTILVDVKMQYQIARTEIFGPVITVFDFETEEEVIDYANDTVYGLASYYYTTKIDWLWRIAEALDYGMVGVNTARLSSVHAPFGGVKSSGYGREGSKYGLDEYMTMKYIRHGMEK